VEFLDRITPGLDLEIGKAFQRVLQKQGMSFHLSTKVVGVEKKKTGLAITVEPAAGGAVVVAGGPAPAAEEKKAESTEFNVILEGGFDAAKKIGIIKVVREITGQGLAEAKATVEGAPKPLKEGVDKATAEKIKKSLEEAGAKVSIKGV